MNNLQNYEPWPAFSYDGFKTTSHLLHMLMQAIGKLKLTTPFEPEWANVGLWITSQGVSTGLIPYKTGGFAVDVNFITHKVICTASWGQVQAFNLSSMSVADLTHLLFATLKKMDIDIKVNPKPQEVSNPILFQEDTEPRTYDPELINAWWRILLSSQNVMQRYHAKFTGKTQPIVLMWGTLDLRDVRYSGELVKPTGINTGYIRRNSADAAQIESGWWSGTESYPRPAYFSFTYPQPKEIEQAKIAPMKAKWNTSLNEFILDYDDVYKSKDPDAELLSFLESSYKVGAEKAHWDSSLISIGRPI